ncbi:MAG: (d)CMP kinase [Clostridia bacterium]|nr:(d)CMP kinase [Clostridia bacterium]
MNVAIDGPSGAGKSSVSKAVARANGFIHIDTGAMYRALAYNALQSSVDVSDINEIKKMLDNTTLEIKLEDNDQKVFINNEDVTGKIRTEQVSMMASKISKIPMVREFLLDMQRSLARENNVVMDGRDIGTVVLPNAELKIFLTASAEKRAERRYKELLEKNEKVEYNIVLRDVIQRDKQDTERETAPLKAAADSVILDTSSMSFEESVEAINKLIKERM